MFPLPVIEPHEPPLRVYSLHALVYCERLFYFQEVENIQVPNEYVYAGRQLHAELAADEDSEFVQIELVSQTLGLIGKVDCLRRRDGTYIPYEHKRGRPSTDSDEKSPQPWPSDRIQIIAYAVLLEEAFGQEHERTYGHRAGPEEPVELVSIQVIAQGLRPHAGVPARLKPSRAEPNPPPPRPAYFGDGFGWVETPILRRSDLGVPRTGPLIVEEYDATCVIPPGARAALDAAGNIVIELDAPAG